MASCAASAACNLAQGWRVADAGVAVHEGVLGQVNACGCRALAGSAYAGDKLLSAFMQGVLASVRRSEIPGMQNASSNTFALH